MCHIHELTSTSDAITSVAN